LENQIAKESIVSVLRGVSVEWAKLFIGLEVVSTAYFVFVSAISDEEVTEFLANIGFRDEISKKLSGVFNSFWTVLLVLFLLLVAKYFAKLRQEDAKRLKAELAESKSQNEAIADTLASLTPNLQSFYEATLQSILRKVDLEASPNVRISIYLLSSDKENFRPAGRYSHNAGYRAQGRTLLPFNEGCIGEAWRVGKDEWRQLAKERAKRRTISKDKYNIPNATFDGLKMQTISIGAYRIDNESMLPVGLLVVEADDHQVIDFDRFESTFKDEKLNLQRLISSTQRFLTDPALALEAGV
jgi:hypothetical protein